VSASPYREQVSLLLRVLPIITREEAFALKGGTAINLFVRDLPRLSIDIDLTYLPIGDRVAALSAINEGLKRIKTTVQQQIAGARVVGPQNSVAPRLFVEVGSARVKVEPNIVIRGSVFPSGQRRTAPAVEAEFEQSVTANVLSLPDLYGGKIVAALDRQHPRDLFDVKLLLESEGITPEIRTAFVVYLASHPRPMAELLAPKLKPLATLLEGEFAGMTRQDITVGQLEGVREELIRRVQTELSADERAFILSMKQGLPEWNRIPVPQLQTLPAIQWKLRNIARLAKHKEGHEGATRKLRKILGV
jgi:predicted nucleotidyltransferase component of viral defense system